MPDTLDYGLSWSGTNPTPVAIDPVTGTPLATQPLELSRPGPSFSQTLPEGWRPPDLTPPDPMASVTQLAQAAYSQLPMKDAEQAVASAVRFQGLRGYQRDLDSGKAASETMAKWGPMMFYQGRAGSALGSSMRAMQAQEMPNIRMVPIPTGGTALLTPGRSPVVARPSASAQMEAPTEIPPGYRAVRRGPNSFQYIPTGLSARDQVVAAHNYQAAHQGDTDEQKANDPNWQLADEIIASGMRGGIERGKKFERKLDQATAKQFYRQAGGDMQKAKQLAKDAGYTW